MTKTLWESTAPPLSPLKPLAGRQETDVAIVGGGIAGLSTALHLAEAGVDVTLLEAQQPGSGATGKSGGLIAPNFIRHSPSAIIEEFGQERGLKLIKLIGHSGRACFDLIDKHGIDCDVQEKGFWCPAHIGNLASEQKLQAVEWQGRGFDVSFVDQAKTQEALSSPRYVGALKFANGGDLNPLAYARGLASAAKNAGAALYGDSPVQKIVKEGESWQIDVGPARLKAQRIILAANGGNALLHPAMQRTVLPLKVFEFATVPLSEKQRKQILPNGGSYTDKQSNLFTARLDTEGRLISAFASFFFKQRKVALLKEASNRLNSHYPLLHSPEIECLWEGTAWLNPSLLPKVYEVDSDIYAIQACNGRGIAVNTVLGQEMAAALVQRDMRVLSVGVERPSPIKAYSLAKHIPAVMMAMAYLRRHFPQSD